MDTAERVEQVLLHYGKKGMKWGVRNDGSLGESSGTKKDWKKSAKSADTANEAFQRAAKSVEPSLKAINDDPLFAGKDLTTDRVLASKYDAVVTATFNEHLAQHSVDLTLNDQGHAMIYQFDRNNGMMSAKEYKIKHADKVFPDFVAQFDELGHVVGFTVAELKHYGTKGMKWGVRKSDRPVAATASQKRPGKFVKGQGGQGQKAHEDAVVAAVARQKARKSTTDALSNQELQSAVQRMNLEQQYVRLAAAENYRRSSLGKRIVLSMFKNKAFKKEASSIAADSAGKKVKSAMAKRAVKTAAAAAI